MALTDFTFQLNSGPILNDDAVGLPFVDLDTIVGLDSAPYRETIRDHEGVDGGFIDAEFERGREISLEGFAYGIVGGDEDYLDDLKANFAPVTSPIPLVFKPPGVAERVIYVKPRGVRYDWESVRRTGKTPIQFLAYAEDPRIYDNSLQNVLINFGGLATTGFAFSFGFNLSFGVTVPPAGANVFNNGNRRTPAIMTITGPVTNPRIINQSESKTLEFIVTLGVGETLTIDLANHTVILNGVTNARNTLQAPDWWLFRPTSEGHTMILFGGQTGSGTLSIDFRNAWR